MISQFTSKHKISTKSAKEQALLDMKEAGISTRYLLQEKDIRVFLTTTPKGEININHFRPKR